MVKKKRRYKRGNISLLREVVKVRQYSKHTTRSSLYRLKSKTHLLMVNILLYAVSIKLQNGLVMKVLKEK